MVLYHFFAPKHEKVIEKRRGELSMKRKAGRPKAGHELLTRERILATALRLVDTYGMEALSMRRLAAELDVDPMAIYHHLPDKRALIAGLVTLVFSELRIPPAGSAAWQDRVRAVAQAYHHLAVTHPNLVLYLVTNAESAASAALDLNEALYEALAAAGLTPQMIVRAADLVVDYVNGFVLAERTGDLGQLSEWSELLALLNQQPSERFPVLRRVVASLDKDDLSTGFEAELEIILAGIAMIAAIDSTQD
jgi:TetR/AcrR family transcriptional regulator, tetracycline repressor protein